MTRKEIKGLSDDELNLKIEALESSIGTQPVGKFINTSFFWNGVWEVVKILIQLIRERRRRK